MADISLPFHSKHAGANSQLAYSNKEIENEQWENLLAGSEVDTRRVLCYLLQLAPLYESEERPRDRLADRLRDAGCVPTSASESRRSLLADAGTHSRTNCIC